MSDAAFRMTGPAPLGGLSLAARIREARIVFFDCDGVLLDSNRIKIDAIAHALRDFPASGIAACLDAFKAAFGRGRREHFETFHAILSTSCGLSLGDRESFVAERAALYADHLARTYPNAPAAFGAKALLALLADAGIPAHVVTGGVAQEAERALANAGLRSGIGTIHGTPMPKAEAMVQILAENNLQPEQAIMFGDARADRDAARETGCPFVFVSGLSLIDVGTLANDAGNTKSQFLIVETLSPHAMMTDA